MSAEQTPDDMRATLLDVRVATDEVGPIVEGAPVDGQELARGGQGRVAHETAAPAAAVAQPVSYVAVEASTTTDPHHDAGSAAVGHVEDASPDTHAAAPPEEAPHEEPATPPPEEPPPTPAAAPEHHDEAATTPVDADHAT